MSSEVQGSRIHLETESASIVVLQKGYGVAVLHIGSGVDDVRVVCVVQLRLGVLFGIGIGYGNESTVSDPVNDRLRDGITCWRIVLFEVVDKTVQNATSSDYALYGPDVSAVYCYCPVVGIDGTDIGIVCRSPVFGPDGNGRRTDFNCWV